MSGHRTQVVPPPPPPDAGRPPDRLRPPGPPRGGLVLRLRALVADEATRSSLALMVSAVGTGLLSFVFWSLIARRSGAAVVGAASAEVATVTFLAGVGSLNMINVFARFLPVAGARSRRLVGVGAIAASCTGAVVALVFLSTPWSAGLVVGGRAGRVGFVVLVVAASVFLIQDGGLIGLGRSRYVPVENIAVAAGRLLALGAVVVTGVGVAALVAAWAVPTVLAVVVVNTLVIRRWAPAESGRPSALPTVRQLGSFVAIESVTTAISSSVTAFLPAIVSQVMGKAAAGYFYVPWLTANIAGLLVMSVLISMVRESVAHPGQAPAVVRRSLSFVGVIVAVLLVAFCLGGRILLSILGPGFVEGAGSLLVWIGISLPATAVVSIYWSVCLIGRKPWPVLAVNLSTTALVIGGVLALGRGGVDRVGMVYCATQWLVAVAVSRPAVRALRTLSRTGDQKP